MPLDRQAGHRHGPAVADLTRYYGVFAPHSRWRGGGKVKVIASIEDPAVIGQILGHLAARQLPAGSRPPSRGPWRPGSGAGRLSGWGV